MIGAAAAKEVAMFHREVGRVEKGKRSHKPALRQDLQLCPPADRLGVKYRQPLGM